MENQDAESMPLWLRLVVGRRPKRTLLRAAILAVLMLGTAHFILLPARITGKSMEPAYMDRSINLINRFAYHWSKPRRGDVVGIKTTGESNLYLKRIIALPGETIAIHAGKVIIDDQPLDEPYVRYSQPWEVPPRQLESDEYLLIGDNRGMPQDYHWWGAVKLSKIVGKAVW